MNSQNKSDSHHPKHIAIIMDGNGRWAKARNLPRIKGHQEGAKSIARTLEAARDLNIKFLTLYAFSSENWNRPKSEVKALMQLLESSLKKYKKDFLKHKIHFWTIGDISALPETCQDLIADLKSATENFDEHNLILALNYGARSELERAVQKIIDKKIKSKDITYDLIAQNLDTNQLPDPDLIIRTSGEMRLSNYLLMQSAYSEFYFTKTLWPDFSKKDLEDAVKDFKNRSRRYGLTDEQIEKI